MLSTAKHLLCKILCQLCPKELKMWCVALYRSLSQELQIITCHMESDSVTCQLIQVNVSCLNSRQTDRYLISVPHRDRRLS